MSIPSFDCKAGCHDCCGPVPFTKKERDAAISRRPLVHFEEFGDRWMPSAALLSFTCPFLEVDGCAIYSDRPMICRVFGASDDPKLTCPHGCGPKKPLTASDAERLVFQ